MQALFLPTSVALVGVSSDAQKIAGRLLPILKRYNYGGSIYPVNPRQSEIDGHPCYSSLSSLPEIPEVTALLVPNRVVPEVTEEAVRLKIPYIVVFSSGFEEIGDEGRHVRERMREILKNSGTRLLGPNCEGYFDLSGGVPLSFSPVIDPGRGRRPLKAGETVVLSQSGGLGFAIADQLEQHGVGIRAIWTTGNEWDLEIADGVRHYAADPGVRQMVLFVEGARDLDKWADAFRYARSQGKILWAIVIGQTPAGSRAVAHHTGKAPLREPDWLPMLREAGVQVTHDMDALVDGLLAATISRPPGTGRRVAIVSSSGGGGIWCADLAEYLGLEVSPPSPKARAELRRILPAYASLGNPIDVTAQALFEGSMGRALSYILNVDEYDAVIIVATLGYDYALLKDPMVGRALLERGRPVVVYSYTPPSEEAQAILRDFGVPWFTSPQRAVRVLAAALTS